MRHIKSLDGLRGLAVILVLLAHTPLVVGAEFLNYFLTFIKLSGAGYIGVEVFFILSGYLITSILIKDLNKSANVLSNFYIKRVFRLLPVIIIAVTGCLFLFPEYEYIYQLFFLSNYYFSFDSEPHPLRHFWSLAVEEQFYIFWPLILLAFKSKINKLASPMLFIAMASFVSIIIYDFIISTDVSRALIYRSLEARVLSLLAGCAMAIYGVPKVRERIIITISIISLGGVLLAKIGSEYYDFTYSATIKSFGYLMFSVCLFVYSMQENQKKLLVGMILGSRFLTYFGKISYGLYVYHLPVFFYFGISHMQDGRVNTMAADLFAAYLVIFAITLISWYLVESPLLKVKDKILNSRNHLATKNL